MCFSQDGRLLLFCALVFAKDEIQILLDDLVRFSAAHVFIYITFTVTFHLHYTSNSGRFAFFSAIFLSSLNFLPLVIQKSFSRLVPFQSLRVYGAVCFCLLQFVGTRLLMTWLFWLVYTGLSILLYYHYYYYYYYK
jgi:hypothetical protein